MLDLVPTVRLMTPHAHQECMKSFITHIMWLSEWHTVGPPQVQKQKGEKMEKRLA